MTRSSAVGWGHSAPTIAAIAPIKADRRVAKARTSVRARRSSRDWPARYGNWLAYTDFAVVVLTILVFRFVALPMQFTSAGWAGGPAIPYSAVLAAVTFGWILALAAFSTRDRHIVGTGIAEYRNVVNATVAAWGFFVAVAFFLRIDLSRALFLIAMPAGLVLLILSRWMWRQWLRNQQRDRKFVYRALVLAEPAKAAHVVDSIIRAGVTGFDLVGVVTSGRPASTIGGVPVVGGFSTAIEAMDATDADTIVIAGADELDPSTMRRLGWALADRDANLVVAPALTDVGGPRIHSRPVAGLPLVHVEFPRLDGGKRAAKRVFDVLGALCLIAVLSPFMLATVIAIAIDSRGPILYRQARIGREGEEFGMLKFRSMDAGADDQLGSLLDLQGTSDRPLFKVVDDPRITRVGRFLRKHSIDELPQLFNVLLGHMSLVGPRPQRPAEVALYDDAAHRRLHVKPGMSGLWQVSGRSKLTWDDSLRLDLYYIENWSFTQDIQILFRTFRAVLIPGAGAH